MKKILAFRGDYSRGKEIKTILEKFGGYDASCLSFTNKDVVYYIKPSLTKIGCDYISDVNKDDFAIFTIDEFKDKFKFNVGDLVRLGESSKIDTIDKVEWDYCLGEVVYEITGDWYRYCDDLNPVEKNCMNKIGITTELLVQIAISKLGAIVSIPYGDCAMYDHIWDIEGKLLRVQIKTATTLDDESGFKIPGRNLTGKYDASQVDGIATIYGDKYYFIPIADCSNEIKVYNASKRTSK